MRGCLGFERESHIFGILCEASCTCNVRNFRNIICNIIYKVLKRTKCSGIFLCRCLAGGEGDTLAAGGMIGNTMSNYEYTRNKSLLSA